MANVAICRIESLMRSQQSESSILARINFRVSPSIKRRAEEAAEMLGQSMTTFAETALAEKAEQVFSRFGSIRLSERDFQRFVKAINNPPQPASKLRKAAAKYKRLRAQEPASDW
jgi:uncharacterized protein (DUF1778 family)